MPRSIAEQQETVMALPKDERSEAKQRIGELQRGLARKVGMHTQTLGGVHGGKYT